MTDAIRVPRYPIIHSRHPRRPIDYPLYVTLMRSRYGALAYGDAHHSRHGRAAAETQLADAKYRMLYRINVYPKAKQ